jgi:hypothetical protein
LGKEREKREDNLLLIQMCVLGAPFSYTHQTTEVLFMENQLKVSLTGYTYQSVKPSSIHAYEKHEHTTFIVTVKIIKKNDMNNMIKPVV